MDASLTKLISIASPALGKALSKAELSTASENQDLPEPLRCLYLAKNGFFAFESALHVFPVSRLNGEITGYNLHYWNTPSLWKNQYPDVNAAICFAEDIFGVQWMWQGEQIVKFDPETGAIKAVAATLDQWAQIILSNYKVETGWPLANAWQKQFRPLLATERLVPKRLFVLGGSFETGNLYAMDAVQSMLFRADVAKQIRDLPDGTRIKIKLEPNPDG